MDCISFNDWNPVFGDEYWASPNYERMIKENKFITHLICSMEGDVNMH